MGKIDEAKKSPEQIAERIDVAESILAQTASGLTSPLLGQHGLVGALEKELGEGQSAVLFDADGVGQGHRLPAAVESAVWFCCLEAVNNARKHAPGASISVRLRLIEDELRFSVEDDGPGWDMSRGDGSPGAACATSSRGWLPRGGGYSSGRNLVSAPRSTGRSGSQSQRAICPARFRPGMPGPPR